MTLTNAPTNAPVAMTTDHADAYANACTNDANGQRTRPPVPPRAFVCDSRAHSNRTQTRFRLRGPRVRALTPPSCSVSQGESRKGEGRNSPRRQRSRVDNGNFLDHGRPADQHQAPKHPEQRSTPPQPRPWIRSLRSGAGLSGCAPYTHQRIRQRLWRASEAHALPMCPPAPTQAGDRLASLTGWLSEEGARPMLRPHRKGSHARVLAFSLGKEERKARAWNTARARARRAIGQRCMNGKPIKPPTNEGRQWGVGAETQASVLHRPLPPLSRPLFQNSGGALPQNLAAAGVKNP